jgi:transposase
MERESRIRKLNRELRNIKEDLLNVENTNFKSNKCYHSWIVQQKQYVLPNKTKFMKKSIYYDLKCHPKEYLVCMIFMMKQVELSGETVQNVFPLRNSIEPHYIRLDTTTLVNLLMRKEQGNKGDYLTEGNLKKNENKIWEFFFRTERKMFKKTNYSFHHMISTDGVGVSILFLREDLVGKRIPTMKVKDTREKYIDEIETKELQTKKIVGIDPNKGDLIYCVDECSKESNTFRYSQDQRRKETKSKKYRNIIQRMKHHKVDGKNIYEYETELSHYNRKTLDVTKFKEYLTVKNRMNYFIASFYQNKLFRKLKFNSYINTKKSEQKMICNFRKIFGTPEDVVICIGDWEQRKQMKFKEPTLGVGMRTLFRKNGYKVYLVDEYRTSCRCSKCDGGICEKFLVRENPKPKKSDLRLVWGLLRCKNGCGTWNRDRNSASNIYKIAYNAIHNVARPSYLCRTMYHTTSTSSKKQNIHGNEKTQP